MKIKSISAVNFKGRSFKNDLAPITVFVGNNFAGKSSRTEAMTLALASFIPGIEKKPGSIFERLASGKVMSVKTDFDEGKFISREYNQTAKGVRCTVSHRGLSDSFAVDPVLIDANEFLGLSAKERVKFLFQRLTLQGEVTTPASLIAKVDTAKMDYAERSKEVLAAIETEITADHEQAVTNGLPPQAWLESLAVTFNQRLLDARARYKVLLDAQQGMAGSSVEGSVNSAAIKERLTKAQAVVKTAREAWTAARVARDSVPTPTAQPEIQAVTKETSHVEHCKSDVAETMEAFKAVAAMECCDKCGAKNKGWRARIESVAMSDVRQAEEALTKANEALTAAQGALTAKQKEIDEAKASQDFSLFEAVAARECDVNVAETELQAAQAEHDKVVAREAEESQRQAAAKKMVTAMIEGTVLKEFSKVITESLDSLITSSIEPFVAKINSLCEGILTYPIDYKDGELGMVDGLSFFGWKSFSGTERALFMCAVSIALAEQSSLKVCVLDEMGRLDSERKDKLLLRLVELIYAGTIEQAILIDVGAESLKWWQKSATSEYKCFEDGATVNKSLGDMMAVVEIK